MSLIRRVKPTHRWVRSLCVFGTYVLASDLLPVFLLLFVNCIGYLPYSDRPGPGWQHPHLPDHLELGFFLSFALLLGWGTLIYAAAHTLLAIVYELCSLPRWLVRVLGGITAFLSAGLLMEGVGWMIAISAVGIYIAAACGLLWGIFLLPAFYAPRDRKSHLIVRIAGPLLICGAGLFYLLRPFLPRKPVPPIKLSVMRITPSTKPVDWQPSEFFSQQTWAELDRLNLRGDIHGGIQAGISGQGPSIDVVIVALQPIDHKYKIKVPSSGHVVYVLDHNSLTAHPAMASTDSRTFTLKPGTNKALDGATLRSSDRDEDDPFTWYPTIPR